ncbi:MAG: AAA family ATPase [Phyllobacterium sp.]|uniref:AAA family ATPase n=1 Tax=Phyllobacterium sp. TaxID=1871046 RepID=UPI0030F34FAD
MIFIDRGGFPSPVSSELETIGIQKTREYYGLDTTLRRQTKLDLIVEWRALRREVEAPLRELFHNKCAFCETRLEFGPVEIDRFRPPVGATNMDGRGSLDHYGWLALEWNNLYPICGACNRAKKSLFPVRGERAAILTPIDQINSAEIALLLDPANDQPETHFEFAADGSIKAITERGEVTIKVFNLNRTPLRDDRREIYQRTTLLYQSGAPTDALTSGGAPYSATARAAVASFSDDLELLESFAVPEENRTAEVIMSDDEDAFRLTSRPLESVSIRNFRMLQEVDLRFSDPRNDRAPWLMLLGENASGKSSFLQAVALALAGAEEASRITRPSKIISAGRARGQVTLKFWDNSAPVELRFDKSDAHFEGTRRPSAIVLGYGSVRYPDPRVRDTTTFESRFARISNLIRPIARMRLHRSWLRDLPSEQFDIVGRVLKEILPIEQEALLLRRQGRVFFRSNEHIASLTEMSAGYQAIVAVCLDIMRLLFEWWETLQSATAIVIIDEIDAHLHPRWKMRIVGALRTCFPLVQFIASTHDPLVLRGLRNGEVALMERNDEGAVIANRDLPPVEGMLVDDLLVSRHFGLGSTIDPTSESLYNEYYHLLSLPAEPVRDRRISELRERLGDKESFGRNQRENLFLAAAELALAGQGQQQSLSKEELTQATISRLKALTNRVGQRRPR